ncbi:MAG: PEP-CTERM sorting domain-containing protein [Phycisphaerales bacterium]|nr:PEP-CTERM sorting domain-containing protein [Phycisphaerales bacterium]
MKTTYTTVLAAVVALASGAAAVHAQTVIDLNTGDNSGWMEHRYVQKNDDAVTGRVYSNPATDDLLISPNGTIASTLTQAWTGSGFTDFHSAAALTPAEAFPYANAWLWPSTQTWTATPTTPSWVSDYDFVNITANGTETNGTSYIYVKTFTLGPGSYTLSGQFAADDWVANMSLMECVGNQWTTVDVLASTSPGVSEEYASLIDVNYTFNADPGATYALVANVINSHTIGSDPYNQGVPPMPTGFLFGGTVTSNTPEPASLSLLGLGAVTLMLRRRK